MLSKAGGGERRASGRISSGANSHDEGHQVDEEAAVMARGKQEVANNEAPPPAPHLPPSHAGPWALLSRERPLDNGFRLRP
jgi:hypothetical protein